MQARDNRYILRLWWDGERDDQWRASLRDIDSEDVINFASVEQLVVYLGTLTRLLSEDGFESKRARNN